MINRPPNSPLQGPQEPLPALDPAFERALAQPPTLVIPADFAARVAALATVQPRPHALSLPGWGPRLALASTVVLTLAMFALAPHTSPSLSNLRFDTELLLLSELCALLLFAPRLLPHS